jgi:hypothetical protein
MFEEYHHFFKISDVSKDNNKGYKVGSVKEVRKDDQGVH